MRMISWTCGVTERLRIDYSGAVKQAEMVLACFKTGRERLGKKCMEYKVEGGDKTRAVTLHLLTQRMQMSGHHKQVPSSPFYPQNLPKNRCEQAFSRHCTQHQKAVIFKATEEISTTVKTIWRTKYSLWLVPHTHIRNSRWRTTTVLKVNKT